MKLKNIILNGLISFIPVAVIMALWILIRAQPLVEKSVGMAPGFLVPRTTGEAIRTGYIIWLPISLVLGVFLALVYYWMAVKWHWKPYVFSIIVIGIAAVISAGAFASGMTFAAEATGEMLIIAIGYGVLIPVLSGRKQKEIQVKL